MPYKWSKDIWEEDAEWWNPYNKRGRLKGKGSTTWKRQAVRAAGAQPLQKRQGEEKVKEEEPLQNRQEATAVEQPLEKMPEEEAKPLEKGKKNKKKLMKIHSLWKKGQKNKKK